MQKGSEIPCVGFAALTSLNVTKKQPLKENASLQNESYEIINVVNVRGAAEHALVTWHAFGVHHCSWLEVSSRTSTLLCLHSGHGEQCVPFSASSTCTELPARHTDPPELRVPRDGRLACPSLRWRRGSNRRGSGSEMLPCSE